MFYSSFGILALIITIIINYNVLKLHKEGEKESAKIKYKYFLICVMVYFVSDILWGFLYEAKLLSLVFIDTVVYFLTMAFAVLLWTRFVVDYLDKKNVFTISLKHFGHVFLGYTIIALIINFFEPVAFSFNENMVYTPGYLRYITLIIQIVLFLSTAIYTLICAIKMKDRQKRHYTTIGISGLVLTAFVVAQTFLPLLPFYAVGCLIATCLVHTYVTNDDMIEYNVKLGKANRKVYVDPLTSVKSTYAYLEDIERIDDRIASGELKDFSVAVFDLNGLKKINDKDGHDAGNQYIKDSSQLICKQFKHSPVYRIGGDEFVAILEGEDYINRAALMAMFEDRIGDNVRLGNTIVIASGYSDFVNGKDKNFREVFEIADSKMYERKDVLKQMTKDNINKKED